MLIKTKLALNAIMPVATTLVVAVVIYSERVHLAHAQRNVAITHGVFRTVFELNGLTEDCLVHGNVASRGQWLKLHARLGGELESLQYRASDKNALVASLRQEHAEMGETFRHLLADVHPAGGDAPAAAPQAQLLDRVFAASSHIVSDTLSLTDMVNSDILAAENAANRLVLISLLLSAAAVASFSFLVFVRVMRPIRALQRGVREVSSGNLDHHIRIRPKRDEITDLAAGFNEMIHAVKAARARWQGEIADRRHAEQRVNHLNAVLRAIRDVNAAVSTTQDDVPSLLNDACARMIATRGYFTAWAAVFDEQRRLTAIGQGGMGEGFCQVESFMREGHLPPCAARAIEAPGVHALHDPDEDTCGTCPAKEGQHHGAVLSARLGEEDRALGVLVASLPADAAEDKDEQELFGDLAADISFALRSIEQEQARRRAEEELAKHRDRLEELVAERTAELSRANELLKREIQVRQEADLRLQSTMDDLTESNQELEHFAYVASHDLKEPLRKIRSFTDLLARRAGPALDEHCRSYIAYSVDAANRLQQMIDDLLIYSRAGRTELVLEQTDLGQVVGHVVSDLSKRIEETGAHIQTSALPSLAVHASQIAMVFRNLIANGIKFHGDTPPTVQVSAREESDAWVFSVKDNGIGIAPSHFPRLFHLFQRLHSRAEYPGTGIGLAVCKRIVERHGGKIWIESEVGQGAEFLFALPKAAGRATVGDRLAAAG